MTKPVFKEINMMGNNRSNRWGARVVYFLGHTEEGNATAVGLANSLNNRNDASYHYVCRDSILCDVVDTDYASWSVLDANNRSINFCFAGSRAAMSRQEWINRYRNDIRIMAWVAVQDAKKYGFSLRVQGRPYRLGNVSCVADHNFVTQVLDIGSHTDLGPNFPFDLLEADINLYLKGATVAPFDHAAAIATEVKRATWLGKALGAIAPCPDGKGKWQKFEHGHVYAKSTTGAHAIPSYIFDTWADLKWETGPLGYPTGDHTILADGEVQGFEHGAIYRKGHPGQNEQPGFFVTGDIRSHWNRTGFEKGPYGYPVSNEVTNKSGTKYQVFEKGRLIWSPDKVVGLVPQDGPDIIN